MAKPKRHDLPNLSDLALSGAQIAVRVTPKAARNSLSRDGETLRASVTAVPENGKANSAVQALLAKAMGVAPSRLELRRGQKERDKLFVYIGD